ncbi:MAG: ABC-F family ATP-binding cassette domain-containing protein [Chthonomonadales bacterium]
MSVLIVESLEKSFGVNELLRGVNLRLAWGQKLGLVGPNGCGKTTLMRILAGQMEADRGSVRLAQGVRLGYLKQEQMVHPGRTVYEEAQAAFAPVRELEAKLQRLHEEMAVASADRLHTVLEEYTRLHDRWEAMGGYESLRDIGKVLERLGFSQEDQQKPVAALSGGQKTRLALASLILSAPDVLLLDEPTNHLDLQATEWLEQFLEHFAGALILVSHDRYFLDRVAASIAELENGRLTLYRGNFSAYRRQKQQNEALERDTWQRQEREVQRLLEFYEKWKNTPRRRSQAAARLKWAERIQEKMPPKPSGSGAPLRIRLQTHTRSGNEVVELDRVTKRFEGMPLFTEASLVIPRGMRLGIVGPNGAGKSTLVRLIIGKERPTSGSVRLGASVTLGYFAQEASELDADASVLENMFAAGETDPAAARAHLGRFLFKGDDVFKPVSLLSGGEKNRLVLAQLTWLRPNLLILDEPTNHLDIASREALAEMLAEYGGTLLLISHDRYLLDRTTNHTLELEGGVLSLYSGNYSQYRRHKELGKPPLYRSGPVQSAPTRPSAEPSRSPTHGMNSFQLARERRRAARNVQALEERVAAAEDWVKRIEEALAAPLPGEDVVRLARDYDAARAELQAALAEWEEASLYAQRIGAGS